MTIDLAPGELRKFARLWKKSLRDLTPEENHNLVALMKRLGQTENRGDCTANLAIALADTIEKLENSRRRGLVLGEELR